MKISGVIEGFYGRPWNARQRHQLFGWMRDWGLNTYLYAPKDDRKHRSKWRELYDETQLAELSALARDCGRHGLRFAYAIAPGLDIRFTSREDREALAAKCRQVIGLGARSIALLFDDIPARLHPDDQAAFQTPARAQAVLANELRAGISGMLEPEGLWFCPTEYCGRMAGGTLSASAYLSELGRTLAPEIPVFWTGPEIVSREITRSHLEELGRVLKRPPLIWDNIHANDYDTRRVHLGPFSGREPEAAAVCVGWLTNPNCEFEANFIGVHTLASWIRDGDKYAAEKAYFDAIRDWSRHFRLGENSTISEDEIQWITDLLHLPYGMGSRGEALIADLRTIVFTDADAWGGALESVQNVAARLARVHERLCELENRDLLHALYRQIWDLKEALMVLLGYADWKRNGSVGVFQPREFSSQLRLGGTVALLQGLLRWDPDGSLVPGSLPSDFRPWNELK